mmetsp:Transcript_13250/g.23567  ORF Transcript_13250/g.23567 Transcript_13250/m.23567 type:complete len:332 (+) Transcript_13250:181-1176(+)
MGVKITPFLATSEAAGLHGRDAGAEKALAARDEAVRVDGFFQFHADHVVAHQDNLFVNSLCLPVYAVPLQNDELREARKNKSQSSTDRTSKLPRKRGCRVNDKQSRVKVKAVKREQEDVFLYSDEEFVDEGDELEDEYVTRSGRQTKRQRQKAAANANDSSLQRARRRQSHGPAATIHFPHLRGIYEIEDFVTVTASLDPQRGLTPSHYIQLDRDKKVSAINSSPPPGLVGIEKLQKGDQLISEDSHMSSFHTILTFRRVIVKNIQKIFGLQGKPILPKELYDNVRLHGGYDNVVATRAWQTIRLNLGLDQTTSSSHSLKKAYLSYFVSTS